MKSHYNTAQLIKQASQLLDKGQLNQSEVLLDQANQQTPDDFELLFQLGRLRYHQGTLYDAIKLLEQAYASAPEHEGIRSHLFAAYKDSLRLEPMIALAERFLEKPQNKTESALAFSAFLTTCDWQHAYSLKDRVFASAIAGKLDLGALPSLFMDSNGISDLKPELSFQLHQAWAERFEHIKTDLPIQTIDGRIRLAYVSGDFNFHPVAYFMLQIIAAHHRSDFEVFCYAQMAGRQDEITEKFSHHADHFIDISNMDDQALATRLRQDGIHIAVDLSSHTQHSRTSAFALRMAPVQISYLGYPNTSGLKKMDFHITDHLAEDIDNGTLYSEELLFMPNCFLCYGIDWDVPKRSTAPFQESKQITFASFNHRRKLNPEVIEAWSRILVQVENSVLLLKFTGSEEPLIKANIYKEFARHSVKPERIEFLERAPTIEEHIMSYHKVDIALDTFPYTGTTTTCEALAQGVPVVTLVGNKHANRVSYSILKNIGFEETIAYNIDEYVEKAVNLATKPQALNILRSTLPLLLQHSPLRQVDQFVANLEMLYKQACIMKGLTFNNHVLSGKHSPTSNSKKSAEQLQEAQKKPVRKLHIGGKEKHPEWEILDAIPSELTDHIGNANDLSMFEDETFEAVYSSHVLEHFSYHEELSQVLTEWHRIMKPGGTLYASVPNLEVLCELFLKRNELSLQERFLVMRMMFGGQVDAYDFHKVGYDPEILATFLGDAGFENIQMVPTFGLFQDTSNMEFAGKQISLNLIAEKPQQPQTTATASPEASASTSPQAAASTSSQTTASTSPQTTAAASDDRIKSATWVLQVTNTKEITIAEVGARIVNEGNEEAPELFHNLQYAKVISFEPDARACEQINTLTTGFAANICAYPYALGEKKGSQTLYVTQEGMCSSLYKPNEALIRHYEGLEVSRLKEEIPIDVITLDEFMQVENIGDLDFIKIDVQGGELDVFKGSEKALQNVIGICTEIEWSELYENQPMFADVDSYLKSHGFQLHHFLGAGSLPMKGGKLPGIYQYLWSDAIYFPTLKRINTLPSNKLIKLAAMAMMYSAYDLAAHTLKRYDELNKTELATIFRDALQPKGSINKP